MSKILGAKAWLTLSESARFLSSQLDEEVTQADIIYFALTKELKMSAYFVSGIQTRKGRLITANDGNFPEKISSNFAIIDKDNAIVLEEKLTHLRGVYDLPLFGTELVYLTSKHQELTGGVSPMFPAWSGPVLENEDNLYVIQHYSDEDPYVPGSESWLERIKHEYEDNPSSGGLSAIENYENLRENLLRFSIQGFSQAYSMPEETELVVRGSELKKFISKFTSDKSESKDSKTVTTNERNTLLVMIAALCEAVGIDPVSRQAAADLVQLARAIHVDIDDGTVRSKLRQLPDALAARRK